MNDITLRFDKKTAKKLLQAIQKGTFEKLTPAQASALDDLVVELLMEIG